MRADVESLEGRLGYRFADRSLLVRALTHSSHVNEKLHPGEQPTGRDNEQLEFLGDAVLGLVASRMGSKAPRWLAIRNVSDPQIKAEGTLKQQAAVAAQIYKGFGRWSSVCSAITCWASIVAD